MKLWLTSQPAENSLMSRIVRFAANQIFLESSGMVMASTSMQIWKASGGCRGRRGGLERIGLPG